MIIPAGCGQANFIYTGIGQPTGAQWTLGFDHDGGVFTPTSAGAALLSDYLSADMEQLHCGGSVLAGILVKFGPNNTGPSAVTPASVVGTAGGTNDSPNTAMLFHKNTGDGGRAGRGRCYFPGLPSAKVDENGALQAAWIVAVNTILDSFYDKLVARSLMPMVLHAEDSPISTPSAITSITVDPVAATQRRRLRR